MSNASDTVRSMVQVALFNQPRKTEAELRALIRGLSVHVVPILADTEVESIARDIEFKQGIKAGLGAIVDGDGFEPWLDDAKSSISPYYWDRYKTFLSREGLAKDVVTSLDTVTDKILSRLGNPTKQVQWDRRGMVVGHVQSGKTANYTGLICKAADAGYRLIIVIAGIHNNLRNQTQARIDEGFIGKDTGKSQETRRAGHVVGVGAFDTSNTPVSLTNTLKDFDKSTASTNTSEINSYKVPVVLVIKKNHRTLRNLLEWLRDNSARGDQEMIEQPMLLIDDEADNASINTKFRQKLVTTINGQIRDLLNMFHRSCYIGYTATPFANIFIDPDQDDEMYDEDLFPKDFIIGLDAPSNYFGPTRIFLDGRPDGQRPVWLRYISDNEDVLPIKHKIDHSPASLPPSLLRALRAFLLARTIRNLRGQRAAHCSMLVNASRFTDVQGKLRYRLHEALVAIQNSIRVNASRGGAALADPEIAALHEVWQDEYAQSPEKWPSIQKELFEAAASAKIVEVNNRLNELSYPKSSERGQTVVAVGGFSLSRGLTLEGLTTTWFLRNTMMYDTLMQMGRWFGYRDGYEDLCRIWMPADAIDWYAFIADATEELHEELRSMEKAKATPRMFGLAVRSHPASLLVTARNKMGAGQKVTTLIGLSNKFVETSRVSIRAKDLSANVGVAKSFVSKIKSCPMQDSPWGVLARDVPVEAIDEFLSGWRNAEQSITTDPTPVRAYIRARMLDELKLWDVLVPSLAKGTPDDTLGIPVIPANRYVDLSDLRHDFMSFSGKRMRVASRGIEKAGVDPAEAVAAEGEYREKNGKADGERVNYPDSIYRRRRRRGLFILHLVRATPPEGEEKADGAKLVPEKPVVAWGISLPVSARQSEKVAYVVNTQRYRELFGEEEEDEENGGVLEAE